MQPANPRLELLPHKQTLFTWEMQVNLGGEARSHQLRFAVRLNPAAVERLITDVGCERAMYLLWTHFRSIPSGQASIDSDRVSLAEWACAVDDLLTGIQAQSTAREPCWDAHLHL